MAALSERSWIGIIPTPNRDATGLRQTKAPVELMACRLDWWKPTYASATSTSTLSQRQKPCLPKTNPRQPATQWT